MRALQVHCATSTEEVLPLRHWLLCAIPQQVSSFKHELPRLQPGLVLLPSTRSAVVCLSRHALHFVAVFAPIVSWSFGSSLPPLALVASGVHLNLGATLQVGDAADLTPPWQSRLTFFSGPWRSICLGQPSLAQWELKFRCSRRADSPLYDVGVVSADLYARPMVNFIPRGLLTLGLLSASAS